MGFLFPKAQSSTDPRLNSMQVNQSSYGNAIPLVYGRTRVPMFLLHYLDFKATAHTAKQSGGGKGGGGPKNTSFTYSAALVIGLCEGQIPSVESVWADKAHVSLSDLGLTLFSGSGTQAAWSYLTTNHPTEAIPYNNIAYVANGAFDLGGSAALPNLTFEINGLCQISPFLSLFDGDPATIITDYCTHPIHGCNFPYLDLTAQTGADPASTYVGYCVANAMNISPAEMTQRPAVEFLREICKITNSDGVYSVGKLRIVPYADAVITGNGATYTPDLVPIYSFGDSDYIYEQGDAPVLCDNKPSNETFNVVRVEFLDKVHEYNTDIAEAKDDDDIRVRGLRVMATVTLHSITNRPLARLVAQLILQRQLYVRSTFAFSVRADYSLLEPMDLVAINDSLQGIVNQLIRITETEDDDEDVFSIKAEEMLVGPASAPRYDTQAAAGYAANYNVAPGNVQAPLIFATPAYLVDVNGQYELCIAIAGPSGSVWGGCDVYMSYNNTSYGYAGAILGPARYGTLRSTLATGVDPDTTHTLQLQLADTTLQMISATTAEADNLVTLIYVDGEIMSYRDVALISSGQYDLTYLRRGKYGSAIGSHSSGTKWARFDRGLFRLRFDPGDIGKTVYFKFTSFNIYGGGRQSLGDVTAYTYTLGNAGAGTLLPANATFVPRGDCVVVGDRFYKKGATAGWNSDVRSVEAYAGGCTLSFRAGRTDQYFMIGLNDDPLTDQDYASINHAWYPAGDGNAYIYLNGAQVFSAGAYAITTIFSITYDGFIVRHFMDGVKKFESPTQGKVFFLDSSFDTPGAIATDVSFAASPSATPVLFAPRGNCRVSDRNVIKQGGSAAWDSDCYSMIGYPVCHVVWKANTAAAGENFMVALNQDPTADSNYTSLDYAIQCAAGGWFIYEGGTYQSVTGSYTVATAFAITYDGTNVRYYVNDFTTPVRTVAVSGLTLFADSSFYEPNCGLNSLRFGPTTNISVVDTGQIGANAATRNISSDGVLNTTSGFANGATARSSNVPSGDNCEITLTAPAFDCSIIVTCAVQAFISSPGGSVAPSVYAKAAFSDNNGSSWSYGDRAGEITDTNHDHPTQIVQFTFSHSKANAGPMKADIAFENQTGVGVTVTYLANVQMEAIIR